MNNVRIVFEEIKWVECIHCKMNVKTKLIPFGGGRVGLCPECKKIAYNGD